ncbi:unnamed protein product, partial [Rotaria sordida]
TNDPLFRTTLTLKLVVPTPADSSLLS